MSISSIDDFLKTATAAFSTAASTVLGKIEFLSPVIDKVANAFQKATASFKTSCAKLPDCMNKVTPGKAAKVGLAALAATGIVFASVKCAQQFKWPVFRSTKS